MFGTSRQRKRSRSSSGRNARLEDGFNTQRKLICLFRSTQVRSDVTSGRRWSSSGIPSRQALTPCRHLHLHTRADRITGRHRYPVFTARADVCSGQPLAAMNNSSSTQPYQTTAVRRCRVYPIATSTSSPSKLPKCCKEWKAAKRADVDVCQAEQVKHLLGLYKTSLLFLDHDCWLCTWNMQDETGQVSKHFFIPRDWLNTSTLHMAVVSSYGALFCPRYRDVAIVRNGIRS